RALAGTAREAAAEFLRELAVELPGEFVVAREGETPARGLVLTQEIEQGATALLDVEPEIAGHAVLDATLKLELRREPDGWEPVSLHGRWPGELSVENDVAAGVEASLATRFPAIERGAFRARPSIRLVVRPDGERGRLAFDVASPIGDESA